MEVFFSALIAQFALFSFPIFPIPPFPKTALWMTHRRDFPFLHFPDYDLHAKWTADRSSERQHFDFSDDDMHEAR